MLWVALLLLAAEGLLRLPPVNAWLQTNIAPYEHLLWYDAFPPGYALALADTDYAIWLIGSSYMMTGLDPALIDAELGRQGYASLNVQNFGLNRMVNLTSMSLMLDRWLLEIEQPQVVVLGLSARNFIRFARDITVAENSPYESLHIFADSPGDYLGRLLVDHSALFHYGVLARNALLPPALPPPTARGGYVLRPQAMHCDERFFAEPFTAEQLWLDVPGGLARLGDLLAVFERRGIPVLVVNMPLPQCTLDRLYGGSAQYDRAYLTPAAEYLHNRQTAFVALDAQFAAAVPADEQGQYFYDSHHPNRQGALLFSAWTSSALADWLRTLYAG